MLPYTRYGVGIECFRVRATIAWSNCLNGSNDTNTKVRIRQHYNWIVNLRTGAKYSFWLAVVQSKESRVALVVSVPIWPSAIQHLRVLDDTGEQILQVLYWHCWWWSRGGLLSWRLGMPMQPTQACHSWCSIVSSFFQHWQTVDPKWRYRTAHLAWPIWPTIQSLMMHSSKCLNVKGWGVHE